MSLHVLRIWLPDRPGALGAVASRVGAVGGDVIGIDILERGAGRAVDELLIELPDASLVGLLVDEVREVDGVDIEDVRQTADAVLDPRLDALETAAMLMGSADPDELVAMLCDHAARMVTAGWGVVVDTESQEVFPGWGEAPPTAWLLAFLEGSVAASRSGDAGQPDDVLWAPLPAARMAVVLGREGRTFRARERRTIAALARIVDARFRDLSEQRSRRWHPAAARSVDLDLIRS